MPPGYSGAGIDDRCRVTLFWDAYGRGSEWLVDFGFGRYRLWHYGTAQQKTHAALLSAEAGVQVEKNRLVSRRRVQAINPAGPGLFARQQQYAQIACFVQYPVLQRESTSPGCWNKWSRLLI